VGAWLEFLFRHKARSPQVSLVAFSARLPGLQHLSLGRESFAVTCPLALLGTASYPVSVRQPADSFPASFSTPVTLGALRFPWRATTNSPEDFHLQVIAHAGPTTQQRPPRGVAVVVSRGPGRI
jgi:hypothetical protein